MAAMAPGGAIFYYHGKLHCHNSNLFRECGPLAETVGAGVVVQDRRAPGGQNGKAANGLERAVFNRTVPQPSSTHHRPATTGHWRQRRHGGNGAAVAHRKWLAARTNHQDAHSGATLLGVIWQHTLQPGTDLFTTRAQVTAPSA